jgi:hypothetical protein
MPITLNFLLKKTLLIAVSGYTANETNAYSLRNKRQFESFTGMNL